jgi:hypothetical protein
MGKVGDRLGVSETIGTAMFETIKMTMGRDYDRKLLIPEVTRFVHDTIDGFSSVTEDKDKSAFCKKFVPVLLEHGTIEKEGVPK